MKLSWSFLRVFPEIIRFSRPFDIPDAKFLEGDVTDNLLDFTTGRDKRDE
jgi:hypothetical protein